MLVFWYSSAWSLREAKLPPVFPCFVPFILPFYLYMCCSTTRMMMWHHISAIALHHKALGHVNKGERLHVAPQCWSLFCYSNTRSLSVVLRCSLFFPCFYLFHPIPHFHLFCHFTCLFDAASQEWWCCITYQQWRSVTSHQNIQTTCNATPLWNMWRYVIIAMWCYIISLL